MFNEFQNSLPIPKTKVQPDIRAVSLFIPLERQQTVVVSLIFLSFSFFFFYFFEVVVSKIKSFKAVK